MASDGRGRLRAHGVIVGARGGAGWIWRNTGEAGFGRAARTKSTSRAVDGPPGSRRLIRLRGRSLAWTLLGAQSATAVVAALVAWGIRDRETAVAALFGGGVAVAPTAWFAVKVYPRARRLKPAEILGAMYRAELGKLVLTAALFWLGALLFGSHFGALMIACMACLSMNWLMVAVTRFD